MIYDSFKTNDNYSKREHKAYTKTTHDHYHTNQELIT